MTNVEKYQAEFADARWPLPKKKSDNHFAGDYAPGMDENSPLEQELSSWYHSLIGMLS